MRRKLLAAALTASAACGAPARAGAMEVIVADARNDVLYRLVDGDGSGLFERAEATVLYEDAAAGPDLSTPQDLWLEGDDLYLLDGGTLDAILRLHDLDGDGRYDAEGEVAALFDLTCGSFKLRTPNRFWRRDGAFVVLDDSKTKVSVTRFEDLDGDGTACGENEHRYLFDAATSGVPNPPGDPEALCVLDDGSIVVADAATGTIYRLSDRDGDGRMAGVEEVATVYVPPSAGMPPQFSALAPYGTGILAADRAHGVVVAIELPEDGVVTDESALFCGGGPSSPLMAAPSDLWVDGEGRVWVLDDGMDQIHFVVDRNGDGDALDPGEDLIVLADDAVLSQATAIVPVAGPVGPAPTVTGLSATGGSARGGEEVVVSGAEFLPATAVYFGDAPALAVEYLAPTSLRVTTPAGSGTVAVTCANVNGSAALANAWTYAAAELAVDEVAPAEGPSTGGFHVTLRGRGLQAAEAWFDGVAAPIVSREAAALTVTAPPHPAGPVTILVADGVEHASASFTYLRVGGRFTRGDVDADGATAINDAIKILSILFAHEPPPACADRSDVNDDGTINIADAVSLLGYLFGGGPPPRPPFGAEGEDPTEDGLPCP